MSDGLGILHTIGRPRKWEILESAHTDGLITVRIVWIMGVTTLYDSKSAFERGSRKTFPSQAKWECAHYGLTVSGLRGGMKNRQAEERIMMRVRPQEHHLWCQYTPQKCTDSPQLDMDIQSTINTCDQGRVKARERDKEIDR